MTITGRVSRQANGGASSFAGVVDTGSDVVRHGDRRSKLGAAFRREQLNEGGAVDLLEFKHKPRRLAVGRLKYGRVHDLGRPR